MAEQLTKYSPSEILACTVRFRQCVAPHYTDASQGGRLVGFSTTTTFTTPVWFHNFLLQSILVPSIDYGCEL